MLSIQRRSQIVSKEIRLPNGVITLGIFLVSETTDGLQAQLISIRSLQSESAFSTQTEVKALLVLKIKEVPVSKDCVPSPYSFVASKDFSFFTSQLTRAPSFAF